MTLPFPSPPIPPQLDGVYISPEETEGLPAPNHQSGSSARSQASGLVKAHRTGRYGFFGSRRKHSKTHPTPTAKTVVDVEKAPATSLGQTPRQPLGIGGAPGVLSSLLTLYDHQSRSGTSTPILYSDDDASGNPLSRKHRQSSSRETLSKYFATTKRNNDTVQEGQSSRASSTPPSKTPPIQIPRAVKSALPNSRPTAARSAGGVFGGLIATTGNIMGVATPVAASVAPNAKKSGFHLSRYVYTPLVECYHLGYSSSGTLLMRQGIANPVILISILIPAS